MLRPYLISAVERGTGGLKITEPEKVKGKSSVPQWVPLRSAQVKKK
jgi:hypothetical protein